MNAATLSGVALAYMCAHFALYFLQKDVLTPLQNLLIPGGLTVLLVAPLHGLRVVTAWYLGFWAIPVMLPTSAAIIFANWNRLGDPTTAMWLSVLAIVYVVSAPFAFWLLRLCLGPQGHPRTFEWRMIMLAGFISAVVNILAAGLYNPQGFDPRETILWLSTRLTSYMLGLFVTLITLMMVMRWIGARINQRS